MKRLSPRYKCAHMFCGSVPYVSVQLKIKEDGLGYNTHWLCLNHAIDSLQSMNRKLESLLKEERKGSRKTQKDCQT